MNILSANTYAEVWKSLDTLSPSAAFVVSIIHMGKIFSEKGAKNTFRGQGLDMDEFEALFIIEQSPDCRPTDITAYSVMQPAKITRVLDRLEGKGLIERKAAHNDRRSYSLVLTKEGSTAIKKAKQAMIDSTRDIEQGIGAGNLEKVNAVLRAIMAAMGENT
ncbi:MAG: MarR family transcriptional regulator [Spirochaetales bacterium]|nr:MarR family transcriptional regulator [Spirochaetales bacterium]